MSESSSATQTQRREAEARTHSGAGSPRIPVRVKSYQVIHSRPGFTANHDSAQRSDQIARAVFWQPIDTLIARLIRHHGRYYDH